MIFSYKFIECVCFHQFQTNQLMLLVRHFASDLESYNELTSAKAPQPEICVSIHGDVTPDNDDWEFSFVLRSRFRR